MFWSSLRISSYQITFLYSTTLYEKKQNTQHFMKGKAYFTPLALKKPSIHVSQFIPAVF